MLAAAPQVHKWGIYERDPLPVWSKGNVVLLGDACHPMTPYMASGAAMALEDAAVLARAIDQADTLDGAFRLYEQARKPRASMVQAGSSANTWMRNETNPDWLYGYDASQRAAALLARRRRLDLLQIMTAETTARPALIETLDNAATRRTTPVGDGDLVWRIWGTGEPLVLLHGGTGSWMHWMRNVEDLARDRMLLVPDIPGSGESASPDMPTSVEKIAATLLAGIDAIIGADRRFAVAGFSMGGLISGFVARLAGERVTCLVLVGATGTTARRSAIAPMKSWRRLPTDDAKREAHRNNLGILMVHDPDAIDEAALYMQFHNAERSRVRGKHINPTGDSRRHCRDSRAGSPASGASTTSLPGPISTSGARSSSSSSRARPSTSFPAPGIGCSTRPPMCSTGCCASG